MIKTLLFDFDGTLADTLSHAVKWLNALSEKYKYKKVGKKDIMELRNSTIADVIKKSGISFWKLPFFAKDIKNEMKKEIDRVKLFKGTKKMLEELSKDYKIGIVTKNNLENVMSILKREKIECVNFIETENSLTKKEKAIKKAIKKYKLNKEETIYIGDEIRDINASKKSDIKIISVCWGYNSKKALEKNDPDFLAETHKELIKIIKKID